MLKFMQRHFLTGLLAVTPLAITCWILWRFYKLINATMRPWLQRIPSLADTYPEFFLTVLGLLAFVLLIVLVGLFTRNLIGMAFFGLVEKTLKRIPIITGIFTAIKQITEVFIGDRRSAFKKVVIFEYPRRGITSVGFLTHEHEASPLVNVFLPTTPNPTSGYLLVLPREDVCELPLTIEEGIKLIISGGAVMSPELGQVFATKIRSLTAKTADPECPPDSEDVS